MAEEGEKLAIEQQLELAVCSRLQYFKDQADSLTLESVRRLLEKDLGLEKFALDAHKKFIRLHLEKQMDGADDCNSKTVAENEDNDVRASIEAENEDNDVRASIEEATMLPKEHDTKNNSKKPSTGNEEMMDDSPIMGVLTPKSEADTQESSVSESMIEKAILKRADHFRDNSENITLAGVRRLLEEDLGLDKNTLDAFKKFISQKIDQVLNPPQEAKSVKDVKKKASAQVKKSEKISSEEESDSSGGESDKVEDKVRSKKKTAPRRNTKKLEEPKKRKISKDVSSKNQKKLVKRQKVEGNDSDGDGSVSEDGQPQSSVEKQSERKENSAPVYGKKVENLKSIIKACGMSIPPTIYKKAKQEPDNKREAFIVKELEGILSREGLSKNPTEKEIKDCKKRKETARELEGIDMSNIISSSRRRSTFSFVTPPKPEIRAKTKKVDGKDIKNKNKDKDHNDDKEEDKSQKEEEEKDEEKKEGEKDTEDIEGEEEEEEEEEEEDDDEEVEDDESEEFNEDDDEDSN